MKLAIIGSSQSEYHVARQAIDRVWPALVGPQVDKARIGTFIRGGVHTAAADQGAALGWTVTRFHSSNALARWAPDLVLIFWDGRSKGCQQCLDLLTAHRILCYTVLIRKDALPWVLGSNADAIPDPARRPGFAPPNPDQHTLELCERLWANAT